MDCAGRLHAEHVDGDFLAGLKSLEEFADGLIGAETVGEGAVQPIEENHGVSVSCVGDRIFKAAAEEGLRPNSEGRSLRSSVINLLYADR